MKDYIHVIGAGLAGSEAAYQIAQRGIKVKLYEQRPIKSTGAHHTADFAELVCSNSLKSNDLANACGLLKEEMRHLDSLILQCADQTSVQAGQALAVDRQQFSQMVTQKIQNHPLIEVIHQEVTTLPEGIVVLATGPLTSETLSQHLKTFFQEEDFYFYDAAAPLVYKNSIDFNKVYFKDRYNKGSADYINCPMTKDEFFAFYHQLIAGETVALHAFEKEIYFEGCMPIEAMAKRGYKTLTFGPLKPVGLEKEDGTRPFAVVQLRQDDAAKELYNLVGFQTNLLFKEQKRIFSMIPGLKQAQFARYGVMHRNTYLCSPKLLNATLQCKKREDLFIAGQMIGVEGYVESAASGILAGINAARLYFKQPLLVAPLNTMLGSLCHYISHASEKKFQPMNANYGILNVKEDKKILAQKSIEAIKKWKMQEI